MLFPMTLPILTLSLLFAFPRPAEARRSTGKLIECVDKNGVSRMTNRSCKDGEREVAPKALPEPETPKDPAPPGILADRDGVAVRARSGAWTVHNVVEQFRWNAKSKTWSRKGRLGKHERDAVNNAVTAFNMTRGLNVRLKVEETLDPSYAIGDAWKNRERLVIYWAEDEKPGALPPPYRVRDGANFGGCSVVVKNPDGSYAYAVDRKVEPGAEIVGAALFMVEFSRRVRKSFKCEGKAERYELLHQLGHCLGLGHDTPSPSVMGGTCGEDYYPNDVENFRYLYR